MTITNICLLFTLLVDIFLSVIKLSSFSTKKITFSFHNRKDKFILFTILIISVIFNAPIYIIFNQVEQMGWLLVEDENSSYFRPLYTSRSSHLTNNVQIKRFLLSLTILKGAFLILILLIIEVIILYKYRNYVSKKMKIHHSSDKLSHTGKLS